MIVDFKLRNKEELVEKEASPQRKKERVRGRERKETVSKNTQLPVLLKQAIEVV